MSAVEQQVTRSGEPFREQTTPLLRPHQVENYEEERTRLEKSIRARSEYSIGDFNVGLARKRLNTIKKTLDTQAPKPYSGTELDAALKRKKELLALIVPSMPTQAEMRRNPPGARDKLTRWQRTHKKHVLELKNIMLREHASCAADKDMGSADIANIERFRPAGGSAEMSMDNAQIQGAIMSFGADVPSSVTMSDADIEALRAIDPELAARISMLSGNDRQKVKDFLASLGSESGSTITADTGESDAETQGLQTDEEGPEEAEEVPLGTVGTSELE